MENRMRIGALLLTLSMFTVSMSSSAATLYEAARFDALTARPDLHVKIWHGEGATRIDVSHQQRRRLSFIETHERMVLIDHESGVYAAQTFSEAHLAGVTVQVASGAPKANLFAMGAYCKAALRHWSDTEHQEYCLSTRKGVAHGATGATTSSMRAGEFLRVLTATRDPRNLFEQAVQVMGHAPVDPGLPLVIRHFEEGKLLGEFRVLSTHDVAMPRKFLDVPRGLRRIELDRPAQHSADRTR